MSAFLFLRPPHLAWAYDWVVATLLGRWLGVDVEPRDGDSNGLLLKRAGSSGPVLHLADEWISESAGKWLSSSRLPALPLAHWHVSESGLEVDLVSEPVPVLFGKPGFRLDEGGNGFLDLDVPGSAHFMLSRYEEALPGDRDQHDRFPATSSIAYRGGFLDRPIIDEYAEILAAAMARVWPDVECKRPVTRIQVSHDVDWPSRCRLNSPGAILRESAELFFKHGGYRGAVRRLRCYWMSRERLDPKDPRNTFDWIMDLSERYGLRSAFYFLCGGAHPKYEGRYRIGHPAIRDLMRRIHSRGHEIGLHPSYNTYRDPDALSAEAQRLKEVCFEESIEQATWGGRMHFLRWATPMTLYGWERAGMDYDCTLTYADRVGFRCGTCREYPAFDPVERRALRLLIRPLIAMDVSVMDECYMGLGTSAAYDVLVGLKNACRTVGGDFTLLWHNDNLITRETRDLYEQVLAA